MPNLLDKSLRLVKGEYSRMRTEDLLEQSSPAARVPAQQHQLAWKRVWGRFRLPAAQRFWRHLRQQLATAPIRQVVILFHPRDIGGLPQQVFGFSDPAQSFRV